MANDAVANVAVANDAASDVVFIDSSNMLRSWANWICAQFELENQDMVTRAREAFLANQGGSKMKKLKIPSDWARAKLKERIVEDMSRIQALVSKGSIRGRSSPPPLVWVHDGVKQAHWSLGLTDEERLGGARRMYAHLTGVDERSLLSLEMPGSANHPLSDRGRADAGETPWVRPTDLFDYWPLYALASRSVPRRMSIHWLQDRRVSADEMIFAATGVAADRLGLRAAVVSGDWDFSMMDARGGRVRVVDLECKPRPVAGDDHLRWAGMFGKMFANIPPAELPADVVARVKSEEEEEDEKDEKEGGDDGDGSCVRRVWTRPLDMHRLLVREGGLEAVARTAVNMSLINQSPYQAGCLMPADLVGELEAQARFLFDFLFDVGFAAAEKKWGPPAAPPAGGDRPSRRRGVGGAQRTI